MKKQSKQILVIRRDLKNTKGEKVRTGKLTSHCAHAAVKAILDKMKKTEDNTQYQLILDVKKGSALEDWIFNGKFTKITVYVNSEKELLDVYNQAKEKKLICSLITDAGLTEFNGVPTITCCAIGPEWDSEIDEITGGLSLL